MARLVAEELDYYYGRFSQRSVELLLLALPAELEPEAKTALQEALGIPVESLTADAIASGELQPNNAHLLAPAALRTTARQKTLDLLPKHYQGTLRERRMFQGALVAGGFLVLTAILMLVMQLLESHQTGAAKSKLEQTLASLKSSEAYQGVVLLQTQSSAWQTQLTQLRGSNFAHSALLRALSQLTPENIYLSGLQLQLVQDETGAQVAAVSLTGFVNGLESYPEVALSRYIKALQAQPLIRKLSLQNQMLEYVNEERRLRFTLVGEILP
jgi:hypothetical protein